MRDLNLNNVAVKLTEKNIGKVYDILKMFGEDIISCDEVLLKTGFFPSEISLKDWLDMNNNDALSFENNRWNICHNIIKTLIKPKQLKQLLAKSRLKEGDVVVVDNNPSVSTFILELTGENIESFEHINSYDLKNKTFELNQLHPILGGKFLRFATEEEKALLNPVEEKKELYVGKWYKGTWENGYVLAFFQGVDKSSYGIHSDDNEWFDDHEWFNKSNISELNYTEATTEEITEALINEAKRRYKSDDIVSRLDNYFYGYSNNIISGNDFFLENGKVTSISTNGYYHCVFKDGKWAEVIKSDLDKDIQALKDKHPNFRFTITVEDNL